MASEKSKTNTCDDDSTVDKLAGYLCETLNCGKPAKLQCPTCIKLEIKDGSHFCSQSCFAAYWNEHKKNHRKQQKQEPVIYNPWPEYPYTGTLRPLYTYPLVKMRKVPSTIKRPDYADHAEGLPLSEIAEKGSTNIKILTDEEIEGMKVVCKLAREVLNEGIKAVAAGVTTDEIDRIVHEASIERDCYPSPLNYYQFPRSVCTSVNEVICHGIPDMRPLENGDLCNIDVTVYHGGFHGDLNETIFVGEVDKKYKDLTRVTYECLMKGIEIVKPGVKYREIGDVIQQHAQSHGFSVVRSFCGHGIHRLFHSTPNVPHYSKNKAIGVMKAGHTFTIEPMISEGTWRDQIWPDNWTAVTEDGKRSAQFEQTLLCTETGCEILTIRQENNGLPWFMDKL